jgi:hypothetical protein
MSAKHTGVRLESAPSVILCEVPLQLVDPENGIAGLALQK